MPNGISTDQGELDIASAADSISSDLGLGKGEYTPEAEETPDPNENGTELEEEPEPKEGAAKPAAAPSAEPAARTMPKSWAKDAEELWKSIPDAAKDQIEKREKQMLDGLSAYGEDAKFGKPLREAISPFMPMIEARGLDAPKAIQALLNAQRQLDTNPKAGILHIAKSYGVDITELAKEAGVAVTADPAVKTLQEKFDKLETALTTREQREFAAHREKVASEVDAFSKDAKHPYFDECSEDIVAYINAGHTLEAAYEKAVYANPVTRAKELARLQTESEAALRAKAKKEADAKRRGSGTNINAKDTTRTPTAPKGNWEDTLNETMAEIKSRSH